MEFWEVKSGFCGKTNSPVFRDGKCKNAIQNGNSERKKVGILWEKGNFRGLIKLYFCGENGNFGWKKSWNSVEKLDF